MRTNMSYCRHRNTVRELAQIIDEWEDGVERHAADDSTDEETSARSRILSQCKELLEMNGCTVDTDGTDVS